MNFQATKILMILGLFLFFKKANSQKVYIDPTTTFALTYYSNQLKKGQEKTADEQSKLQRAQLWVGSQMNRVKWVQEKVYKGLKEVSGTLTNGLQVKDIYAELQDCRTYTSDIIRFSRKHPQFTALSYKASEETYHQILKIGTKISSTLKSGDLNLATAGDRYKLLNEIEENVKLLNIKLLGLKLTMERAKRLGLWGSINPFNNYINTDKDIVENILQKWEML